LESTSEYPTLGEAAQLLEAEVAHRKEMEELLACRQRELSDFLETVGQALNQIGPDGTIIWANKAELSLLGYRAEDYVGHPVAEFHADPAAAGEMLTRLARGENLHGQPARLRCKDGSIKRVLIHSSGYFEDGKFVYSRSFTRDVTAIEEAQDRLSELVECERAARSEAERAGRIKDEFLATLSHELRTPLSAISGWTHIISQSPGDSETVVHGMAVIDRNVRAQTQLIEDLLDMSRIISGKLQLEMQSVDLPTVVRAAIEAVRLSAQSKSIEIREHIAAPVGPIQGDPNRLQQIVWNLLSNAVKFTPRKGKIDVALARKHLSAEITVTDTGQGIASSFIPHIFERFSQADASTARKHGGLGIGLSIVKQLTELHGGKISVQSEGEGRGATFRVTLPNEANGSKPSANKQKEAVRLSTNNAAAARLLGVNVLVVDDDPDARLVIARLLGDCGATVITASSAAEGMELLAGAKPDLLISDIGMPERDGHDFIRDVRDRNTASYNRIPAMALTAFARPEDRTRALFAGFQVHVAKPIDARQLILAAASLVPDEMAAGKSKKP